MNTIKPTNIYFKDFPDFTPNLTPRQIFLYGSFGGTYWRDLYSPLTKKNYHERYKIYPKEWFKNIPKEKLTLPYDKYDKSINYFGVKVGTSYEFWLEKGWIHKSAVYGFIDWYCGFYNGIRTIDDERQIKRWLNITSNRGRFRLMLSRLIYDYKYENGKRGKWDDEKLYPKMRQTLMHWCYILTKEDYREDIKHLKKMGRIE